MTHAFTVGDRVLIASDAFTRAGDSGVITLIDGDDAVVLFADGQVLGYLIDDGELILQDSLVLQISVPREIQRETG